MQIVGRYKKEIVVRCCPEGDYYLMRPDRGSGCVGCEHTGYTTFFDFLEFDKLDEVDIKDFGIEKRRAARLVDMPGLL